MPKLLRRFLGWAVSLLILGCACWYGIKVYFTYINPIANGVRHDVHARYRTRATMYIPYEDIPWIYRTAVISTEDQSFFTNIGLDVRGVGRAVLVDLVRHRPEQGGSTITQQLVHNTLLKSESKTLTWKIHEALDAIGLYDTMSKQEVFELYANDIYFGQGAYGLYSAAITYFGRDPRELNDGELTMLAGIPNAPSDYNPFGNFNLARQRQQLVLQSMVDNGVINQSTAKQIFEEPIRLIRKK